MLIAVMSPENRIFPARTEAVQSLSFLDVCRRIFTARCELLRWVYCLILGFATEYSTSVRKFTAT
jgi:hypothetical protein